ncbi:MAG: hypothetical protein A2X76_00855 [Lysobacterales bacterium GWF1_69_6]|nr:MAG: hypothetical protein A2X76_00855 [Xanthomonadales bacterium GWF1_69_6]
MPAIPRLDLANVPKHIIQRGVNKTPCFLHRANYWKYLDELALAASQTGCAVHAYVLMTNHVHLLVTPPEDGATSRMMQQLGTRYVRYFNAMHQRTGTLWEGRFRSCLVSADDYFLTCQRYIELNPVRAGMVSRPADYRWSSYHANAQGRIDPVVQPHAVYLGLAADTPTRWKTYAALVASGISDAQREEISRYTHQGRAFGPPAFQRQVRRELVAETRLRKRGRPAASRGSSSIK